MYSYSEQVTAFKLDEKDESLVSESVITIETEVEFCSHGGLSQGQVQTYKLVLTDTLASSGKVGKST